MTEKKYEEKEEKQYDEKDEKELYKHDEKVEQQDALSSVVWAAILIWAGLVFLALNMGWLESILSAVNAYRYLPDGLEMFEPDVWAIIMLGAGVILLGEVIIRLMVPKFSRHVVGSLVLAAVFLGSGLGSFFGWDLIWPFILIALGVGVLLGGFIHRKS